MNADRLADSFGAFFYLLLDFFLGSTPTTALQFNLFKEEDRDRFAETMRPVAAFLAKN